MAGSINPSDLHPPLTIHAPHWQAIVDLMGLSAQQARFIELLLRGMEHKEIAAVMGISETTVKTYQNRIFARTRTTNRMELAMHVLVISHRVLKTFQCPLY